MDEINPVIKKEVENITMLLKSRGFKSPIVEGNFCVEVETYDLANLMDLYYDNSLNPLPINWYIEVYGASRIKKIISYDIQIISLNKNDIIDSSRFIKNNYLFKGKKAGSIFEQDIVNLVTDDNILQCDRHYSPNDSWCTVLLDPIKTDTDYWWFILDASVLYLSNKGFHGYMLILCPKVTQWGTIEGWYRDFVSIDNEGRYNILKGLSHEECYPWPAS